MVDVLPGKVDMVNRRKSLVHDKDIEEYLSDKELNLTATMDEQEAYSDADYVIVIMGSAAGTTKDAVDELREQGIKAGMLKLRVFRPFPADELVAALKDKKAVAILDRCETFSTQGGPVAAEICSAMYRKGALAKTVTYIYGLGGRDYKVEDAKAVYETLIDVAENGKVIDETIYIGLRSKED